MRRAAEADLAEAVDVVVADPIVRLGGLVERSSLDGGGIGLGRGGAVERTMGPDVVGFRRGFFGVVTERSAARVNLCRRCRGSTW